MAKAKVQGSDKWVGMFLILSQLCCGITSGTMGTFLSSADLKSFATTKEQKEVFKILEPFLQLTLNAIYFSMIVSFLGVFAGFGIFNGRRWGFNLGLLICVVQVCCTCYLVIITKSPPDFTSLGIWILIGWYCTTRRTGKAATRARSRKRKK